MDSQIEVDQSKMCNQRFDHRDVYGDPETRLCLACFPNETPSNAVE